MIKENPILGGGAGSFMANYMSYQADYFECNMNDSYSQLADNITHPFNEYLMLAVEYGTVGLFLLFIIICTIIYKLKQITHYHLSLLSIGVFACFSYPLRYPFVMAIIAYSLANIESKNKVAISIGIWGKCVCAALISCVLIFLVRDVKFERQRGLMVKKLQIATTKQSLIEYDNLYRQWNGDPLFLYNYGAELHAVKQYNESNNIMIECIKYFNSYDAQMIIAWNYEKLNQLDIAEAHYYTALYMCPNRFMPLYRLMLLYKTSNQEEKAIRIAQEILIKSVKINSSIVSRIKKDAKDMINKYSMLHDIDITTCPVKQLQSAPHRRSFLSDAPSVSGVVSPTSRESQSIDRRHLLSQ